MKVGRNDPCPCGSGKKYKKCCLDKKRVEAAAERPIAPGSNREAREVIAALEMAGLALNAEGARTGRIRSR